MAVHIHPRELVMEMCHWLQGAWLWPPGKGQFQSLSSPAAPAALSWEVLGAKSIRGYLEARTCPVAFLPGQTAAFGHQLPVGSPSLENLCGHSSKASGKAKRLVTQGEAYLLHLPRALSFPSSLPLVSLPWLPSTFLLAHLVGFQ